MFEFLALYEFSMSCIQMSFWIDFFPYVQAIHNQSLIQMQFQSISMLFVVFCYRNDCFRSKYWISRTTSVGLLLCPMPMQMLHDLWVHTSLWCADFMFSYQNLYQNCKILLKKPFEFISPVILDSTFFTFPQAHFFSQLVEVLIASYVGLTMYLLTKICIFAKVGINHVRYVF
jgi:hypothetical protein